MEIREFRKMPFCWQDKPILKLIGEKVNRKELSSIRNVYLTLTELSSDYNSEDFHTFMFDIAKRSGLSEKTVSKSLSILTKLKIVEYPPQERGTDGKYEKKEIRLTNANITAGNFGESSEKVGTPTSAYIEDKKKIIENNNISKDIETKFPEKKEIEKIKKRIPEIDIIIETIKNHHGSIDGTQIENRRYGKNLKDKIDNIKGFNGDYQGFIKLILDNTDEYNVTKTTSCKALFYNLAALVAKIRSKNQEEKPRRVSIH